MEWYQSDEIFLDPDFPLAARSATSTEPIPPTSAGFITISLVTGGGAVARIAGARVRLRARHLVLLRPGVVWASRPDPYISRDSVVCGLDLLPSSTRLRPATVIELSQRDFGILRDGIEELARIAGDAATGHRAGLLTRGVGVVLPYLLSGHGAWTSSAGELLLPRPRVASRAVQRAVEAITADPGRRWTVAELAEVACLHADSLTRAFRRELDTAPSAYARMSALGEFERMLIETGD